MKTTIERMASACKLLPPAFLALSLAGTAHATDFILANVMDAQNIQNVASRAFIAKLKELDTDIEVEHHPGGDLGDWVGLFEQVMQGGIQMTQTWNASEFDARLDLATLGYTAGTWEECVETYKPGGAMAAFWNTVFPELNMHLAGILPDGMYGVAVRKGVDAPTMYPADSAGFKLRVPPIKIGITRFEALGFSAPSRCPSPNSTPRSSSAPSTAPRSRTRRRSQPWPTCTTTTSARPISAATASGS